MCSVHNIHHALIIMLTTTVTADTLSIIIYWITSGPPRVIHAEAIVHYSTILKQFINTRLCMHANTVLTLLVKSID